MPETPHPIRSRHPVNVALAEDAPAGARIADRVTRLIGSWRFLAIQTVIVVVWVIGNIVLLFGFDPYPFILLNLAFATQAAYTAPLILLASNRAAERDRMTLEHAATEADLEEKQNQDLLDGETRILGRLDELDASLVDLHGAVRRAIALLERPRS